MNRGFAGITVVGIIVLLIVLGGGGYYIATSNDQENVAEGECPVGEPDCKDVFVDDFLPVDGDEESPSKNSPPISETNKEGLERMIASFEHGGFESGVILVNFSEGIMKNQADAILKKYDFGIVEEERCYEEQATGPGQDVTTETICETIDNWDGDLYMARIKVPDGSEREHAELLIGDLSIIWVEPSQVMQLHVE